MRLLVSPTSPYVRKVMIVAAELGLSLETETVNPWSEDSPVVKHNPLGKIPALVVDAQTVIYDSSVICDYLIHSQAHQTLLPTDLAACTRVKTLEALADGLLDASVSIVLEHRRPAAQQSAAHIERALLTLHRGLDYFDQHLRECQSLNLAAIALGVVCGYVEFRLNDQQLLARRQALTKWWQRTQTLNSFQTTIPVQPS
jgi:glutathione S-transferase